MREMSPEIRHSSQGPENKFRERFTKHATIKISGDFRLAEDAMSGRLGSLNFPHCSAACPKKDKRNYAMKKMTGNFRLSKML